MKYRTNRDFLERLALLMDADTLEWMTCKDEKRVQEYGERVKSKHRYFTGLTLKALGYRPLARHLMKLYEEFKRETLEYPAFFMTLQMILANKFDFAGFSRPQRLTEERVERRPPGVFLPLTPLQHLISQRPHYQHADHYDQQGHVHPNSPFPHAITSPE